jgi:hypothetical protein
VNRRLLVVSLLAAVSAPPVLPAAAVDVPRSCTVVGTARAEVLRGTPAADKICGLGGNDVLLGRGGRDILLGGPGADTIRGGPAADRLLGASGRDDLRGDSGSDRNVGGGGDDVCVYDSDDIWRLSCTYDQQDPVVQEVQVLTPTVDVSQESKEVVIRVHVTDDSEHYIASATLHDSRVDGALLRTFDEELVAGDGRDGWWELRRTVPRGFPASRLRLSIRAEDVSGRYVHHDQSSAVTVEDHDPVPLPEVSLLRPGLDRSVDTTSGTQRIAISARVAGVETAVEPGSVALCLEHVASVVLEHCAPSVELVSGNRWDGVWAGKVALRAADRPGEWSPVVKVADTARPDEAFDHVGRWGGGRRWNLYGAPWTSLQPSGADSVISVSSTAVEAAPELLSASLPEGAVPRPQLDETTDLPLQVAVADGGGTSISSVAVHWVPLDHGVQLHGGGPPLTHAAGGQWDGTLQLRSTTPPGRYALIVVLRDSNHLRYYGGDSARVASHLPLLPLPDGGDPIITVAE